VILQILLFLEAINEYTKHQGLFRDHFLAGKPFLTGEKLSIGDLLVAVSFEQVSAVDKNLVESDLKLKDYLDRCKALMPEFDEIHKDIRFMPQQLRQMGIL